MMNPLSRLWLRRILIACLVILVSLGIAAVVLYFLLLGAAPHR